MDPNETLRRLRGLTERVHCGEVMSDDEIENVMEELAELVDALDEWITKGGFLPKAWQEVQRRESMGR